jgi:HSP20 family molecular chaperone IbpA
MAIRRLDSVHDLLTLQTRLNDFEAGSARWVPAVELLETPERYTMTAGAVGLRRADLRMQMHGNRLLLSGIRWNPDTACDQYHQIEHRLGAFQRTFQLPYTVDAHENEPELSHDVLIAHCPKTAAIQSQPIEFK